MLDLPRIFGTTLETLPAEVPYIFADPALADPWRDRIEIADEFKVGIAWRGSPTHQGDRARSFSIRHFGLFADVPRVRWLSLQKGAARDDLRDFPGDAKIMDLADQLHDFRDTAAVMANLDLVITCDSAAAHLAGALGRPVWVALPFAPTGAG